MAELENQFSWSLSRHLLFERCYRRYYLNHYGFWGGWNRQSAPETREIYIQKKLTTRPMWVGSRVHDAAEEALRGLQYGRLLEQPALLERTARAARNDITASRQGRYRDNPKRNPGFQEHYYGPDLGDERWEQEVQEILRQVRSLYRDPLYLRLLEVPEKLREVEQLESLDLDGTRVWVKLDALIADGRGGLVIVDWKTGQHHKTDGVERQLAIYGLYCVQRYDLPPERLTTIYANLRTGQREQFRLDRSALDETRAFVLDSVARMKERLADAERNHAEPDAFPLLEPGDPACRTCRFRRTCEREGS